MGNGLNRTELTGLILLAVIVIVITGSAIWLKGCGSPSESDPLNGNPEILMVDSSDMEVDGSRQGYQNNGRTGRKKSGRSRSATRNSSRSGNGKNTVERSDPFLDTIPLDWDDWEEPVTPFN